MSELSKQSAGCSCDDSEEVRCAFWSLCFASGLSSPASMLDCNRSALPDGGDIELGNPPDVVAAGNVDNCHRTADRDLHHVYLRNTFAVRSEIRAAVLIALSTAIITLITPPCPASALRSRLS